LGSKTLLKKRIEKTVENGTIYARPKRTLSSVSLNELNLLVLSNGTVTSERGPNSSFRGT